VLLNAQVPEIDVGASVAGHHQMILGGAGGEALDRVVVAVRLHQGGGLAVPQPDRAVVTTRHEERQLWSALVTRRINYDNKTNKKSHLILVPVRRSLRLLQNFTLHLLLYVEGWIEIGVCLHLDG